MPAVSVAQRRAIAISEHNPGKLYSRNKDLLSMKKSDMRDFASASEKSLPYYAPKSSTKESPRRGVRRGGGYR